MNPQRITYRDRTYLVETTTSRVVTEITDDGTGLEVDPTTTAEVLDIAERTPPATVWPATELAEVALARIELALDTLADPFMRATAMGVVYLLATDRELHEWLGRIGMDLEGGVAA